MMRKEQWHDRYLQQAQWTVELRRYILGRLGLDSSSRVLEVGCGTGAVLREVASETGAAAWGADIDLEGLQLAQEFIPSARLAGGDALNLPYPAATFDLVYCHFLLLWVSQPWRAVAEMCRVARPGAALVLMAEPDYGGRIDYPQELEILGQWQTESLRRQGADVQVGRRLSELLAENGLTRVESGVLGASWAPWLPSRDWELEWLVLRDDLEEMVSAGQISRTQLDKLQETDRRAWQRGARVLFVPTFFAWGRVPLPGE